MALFFISYSRADQVKVDAVVDALKAHNHSVWLDRRSIPVGHKWELAIGLGIAGADAVLVLVSKTSLASKWMRREIDLANERGGPIFPALLEPLKSSTLPAALRERQAIPLFPSLKDGLERLLDDLPPGTPDGRRIPFFVDHPRLPGFVGRDATLEALDRLLQTAGAVGVRPAAVSGKGGICKNQLEFE